MTQLTVFIFASLILAVVCRKQLGNLQSHGFYRFFAFEGILLLAVCNLDPGDIRFLSPLTLFAALILFASLLVVISSLRQIRRAGGYQHREDSPENFSFENTAFLVTTGIYRHLRHPMYSSLLLLSLGVYLVQPDLLKSAILLLVVVMVYLTARTEEKENILFFGEPYKSYQQHSYMLIPFLL